MKNFNELPVNVQNEVKEILKAYSTCPVTYENGRYSYSLCIKSEYAPDHEFLGEYRAEDIYTEEERILNYIESFHDYPVQYKGERDYAMINEINKLRSEISPEEFWSIKFKFDDNGNIVRA